MFPPEESNWQFATHFPDRIRILGAGYGFRILGRRPETERCRCDDEAARCPGLIARIIVADHSDHLPSSPRFGIHLSARRRFDSPCNRHDQKKRRAEFPLPDVSGRLSESVELTPPATFSRRASAGALRRRPAPGRAEQASRHRRGRRVWRQMWCCPRQRA